MNLRQLEYFRTLAETEHMTQSAELLNISQPSLSHAISELEKELEVELFERRGRNIYLTKYGQHFLNYVRQSLDILDEGKKTLDALAHPFTGHIDLAFVSPVAPVLVPFLLKEFQKEQLYKNIRFTLHQNISENLIQQLKDETIDLAICTKIDDDEIIFDCIAEQEFVLITPLNHPLAELKEIDLKDTVNYPYVYFAKRSGLRFIIDKMMKFAGIEPNISYEIEEDHAIIGFVAQNYGIAVLTKSPLLNLYPVKVIPIKNNFIPRYLYLAHSKKKKLSPSTKIFHNFVLNLSIENTFNDKL